MSEIKRIDIGINLMNKQFNKDRKEIVERALKNGTGLIITGTDLESSRDAIDFIKEKNYKNVWCTVGVHPHNADLVDGPYLSNLLDLISRNKDIVVAVGETGLDYDRMYAPINEQKKTFADMRNTAASFKLPMFLHERAAEEDFVKLMKIQRPLCSNSVVHCFTGNKNTVYRYLQMGFMVGITGWICDNRRNKDLIEAVKIIPLDRILVETDAPYLTPLGLGLPRRNTPDNLRYVIEKIAEIKKIDANELERITLENTVKLFNLKID